MSKANKQAWKAAHEAARKVLRKEDKEHKYTPLGSIWYEISGQLRSRGDSVDMDAVHAWWTTESQQRQLMEKILKQAGFVQEGPLYRWPAKAPDGGDGKPGKDSKGEKAPKGEKPAKTSKPKADGKDKKDKP